ncbi:MAG: uncharacterized protein A8A55_0375 [Amphiamblys sp. WSBS2006]|nr:MAG: uncharacterized protein A8A55_0375 [Amphiamblys sp. WSBS2006]
MFHPEAKRGKRGETEDSLKTHREKALLESLFFCERRLVEKERDLVYGSEKCRKLEEEMALCKKEKEELHARLCSLEKSAGRQKHDLEERIARVQEELQSEKRKRFEETETTEVSEEKSEDTEECLEEERGMEKMEPLNISPRAVFPTELSECLVYKEKSLLFDLEKERSNELRRKNIELREKIYTLEEKIKRRAGQCTQRANDVSLDSQPR